MIDLVKILGRNLTDLLDTETKRQTAAEVYEIIEAEYSADVARSWLIGMNESLGCEEDAPLRRIASGYGADVVAAARAFIS